MDLIISDHRRTQISYPNNGNDMSYYNGNIQTNGGKIIVMIILSTKYLHLGRFLYHSLQLTTLVKLMYVSLAR